LLPSNEEIRSELLGESAGDDIGRIGMLRTKTNNVGEVWLDDSREWLLWRPWDAASDSKRKTVKQEGLLDRFGWIVTPEDVLRFARRNGPLQICHHGVACFHNRPPPFDWFGMETYQSRTATRFGVDAFQARIRDLSKVNGERLFTIENYPDPDQYCLPMTWDENSETPRGSPNRTSEADIYGRIPYASGAIYAEPIAVWMQLVQRVHSTLRIIAALRRQQSGPDADWRCLMPLEDAPSEMTMNSRRYWISDMINEWLRIGDVRLTITDFAQETNSLGWSSSLFGVLAIQLLGVFVNGTVVVCSECLEVYAPIRAPKTNQMNYCKKKKCQTAASKNRKRKLRRAQNAKK